MPNLSHASFVEEPFKFGSFAAKATFPDVPWKYKQFGPIQGLHPGDGSQGLLKRWATIGNIQGWRFQRHALAHGMLLYKSKDFFHLLDRLGLAIQDLEDNWGSNIAEQVRNLVNLKSEIAQNLEEATNQDLYR